MCILLYENVEALPEKKMNTSFLLTEIYRCVFHRLRLMCIRQYKCNMQPTIMLFKEKETYLML